MYTWVLYTTLLICKYMLYACKIRYIQSAPAELISSAFCFSNHMAAVGHGMRRIAACP